MITCREVEIASKRGKERKQDLLRFPNRNMIPLIIQYSCWEAHASRFVDNGIIHRSWHAPADISSTFALSPLHPPSIVEVSSNAALLDHDHEALHAYPRFAASWGTLRQMLMVVFFFFWKACGSCPMPLSVVSIPLFCISPPPKGKTKSRRQFNLGFPQSHTSLNAGNQTNQGICWIADRVLLA